MDTGMRGIFGMYESQKRTVVSSHTHPRERQIKSSAQLPYPMVVAHGLVHWSKNYGVKDYAYGYGNHRRLGAAPHLDR